jgi:hypothetical protein
MDPDEVRLVLAGVVAKVAHNLRGGIQLAVQREQLGDPLSEAAWQESAKAIASAVTGPVMAVWTMAWTAALDTEPPAADKPSRSTTGLVGQLLTLAERLDKRNPEAFARHVSADDLSDAKDMLEELESAAQELETWASEATSVLDEREAY